jgi:hypothetical protein
VLRSPIQKIIVISLLCIASNAFCESNFVRVEIGNNATIEIPKNWQILSANQKTTIDTYVEATKNNTTQSEFKFAANFHNENGKTIAVVNARFYPNNMLTQSDAKNIVGEALNGLDEEIKKIIVPNAQKMGQKIIEWKKTQVQNINGMSVIKYGKLTSNPPNGDLYYEYQYRFWNAPNTFTLTIGYKKEHEVFLEKITKYMAESIKVKN